MFKVAPCQGVLQKTEFGILWNCFKVQHGNWIVATRCLLDSLCWKKCSCLNINIFIRRCAVPSSCAQPHQSASCLDQPVSCAGIFMHFAIISAAYGTCMELKNPWSLWCSPVHISQKSLQAELVKQKTNIVGKKFFYRLCKSYVDFTSEHGPILMPGFHMIAQSLKKKKKLVIAGIIAIIWKPLPSDRSENDPWDRTFSISAITGKWFSYDRYNRCDRWTFFYLSDRRDHMEIGLKCLLKMWLAATCAVHPLVQPLPQSFFL